MQNINNAERNLIILKVIILAVFTYYTNFKIMNKEIKFNLKNNILIILVGIICGIVRSDVNSAVSTISLLIIISIIFSLENTGYSILTTTISLSINYAIGLISIIICFYICKIFRMKNDYIELIFITISNTAILYGIFKIKRFKYGISFLQKAQRNEYIELLLLNISTIILFSVIIMYNLNIYMIGFIVSIEIVIYSILMFITIKKSLQLSYKQKLLIQELEETKAELENKEREIKELEEENINFSKRSHSLIHKQKSLEYKIAQMMLNTETSAEQAAEVKEKLAKINEEIYKEKEIIELTKTGITEIDDMLKYMQSECNNNKIEFILQLKGNIHQMVNNAVSKEDLEILLADHIKNAIIAINHTDNINRRIMVKLGYIDSTYCINIYDSGAEFEIDTLNNLGKKPSSTHAEEGGTGMGFMNTFDTLRKYNASLTIEEYGKPNKENYTKVLSIKFDKNNQFKIKSYRQNVIKM